MLFDVTDHPSALLDLPLGQNIPFTLKGIFTGLKFQLNRRSGDRHGRPEVIDQVTFICPGNLLDLIAMNDHHRWVGAALVGVLLLNSAPSH